MHKYLGMTIDYSSPVKVIFSMINYIGNMIDNIPEGMKGESDTSAAHQLFDISKDATKLSQANVDLFLLFVEQLLYLLKRERPDIHLAVYFLWNRMIGPATDDYNNLAGLMK